MPIPTRVPPQFAHDTLNESYRGFGEYQPLALSNFENIARQGLVQVTLLRPWFANNASYQEFRRAIHVPRQYWEAALNAENRVYVRRQMRVNPSPRASPRASRNSSPQGRRGRSRSPSPVRRSTSPRTTPRYRKGALVMKSKLGRLTSRELADAPRSTLSIERRNDECDDTDVNLPLPVCKAIRKVCRRYNPMRQYMPYKPDRSEHKDYQIDIAYQDS